jgi:hypothetical protein
MTNRKPSKQEHYDTLVESLEFFEAKIIEIEAECDALPALCELFDYQQLANKLQKLNYREELTPTELEVAEDLIKRANASPQLDKDELITLIKETFDKVTTSYLKQVSICDDLEEFHSKEKFNKEVKMRIDIGAVREIKDIQLQILKKRREMKKVLINQLNDEKYKD